MKFSYEIKNNKRFHRRRISDLKPGDWMLVEIIGITKLELVLAISPPGRAAHRVVRIDVDGRIIDGDMFSKHHVHIVC
jgi:hypothetical protein